MKNSTTAPGSFLTIAVLCLLTLCDIPLVQSYDCFPPNVTTLVLGKGEVTMKDLRVGDQVLTSSGTYQNVYTINHMHHSKETKYVHIETEMDDHEPLELSGMHMVFVSNSNIPIPAEHVKVNDYVVTHQGPKKVTSVSHVVRDGLYSPLTTDGTIVANGVYASTYCSFLGNKNVVIGGVEIMSAQSFTHMVLSPIRAYCTATDLCAPKQEMDQYTQAGISIVEYAKPKSSILQAMIFFIILIVMSAVFIICSPCGFVFVFVLIGRAIVRPRQQQVQQSKQKSLDGKAQYTLVGKDGTDIC